MEQLICFFKNHYQWIFSGLGVAVISWLFTKGALKQTHMSQKNSGSSVNIQISGDISGVSKKEGKNGTE